MMIDDLAGGDMACYAGLDIPCLKARGPPEQGYKL